MKTKLINKGLQNSTDCILVDDLWEEFNFVTNECKNELINATEIFYISNKKFAGIDKDVIKTVLDLAKNCNIHKWFCNFAIYENGEVTIGAHMKNIKNNLPAIEKAWQEFQNRPFGNIIKIEI